MNNELKKRVDEHNKSIRGDAESTDWVIRVLDSVLINDLSTALEKEEVKNKRLNAMLDKEFGEG